MRLRPVLEGMLTGQVLFEDLCPVRIELRKLAIQGLELNGGQINELGIFQGLSRFKARLLSKKTGVNNRLVFLVKMGIDFLGAGGVKTSEQAVFYEIKASRYLVL